MTEITNENFSEMFPIIKESISQSSFIAIDTELTGLVYDKCCNPSLFDSLDNRYSKQRQSVSNFIVTQIGLSLYSRDLKLNIYRTKTYTFYLCPRSMTHRKTTFAVDISAIEFLAHNHFSFDKFAINGINYLNQTEEQNLREKFDNCLEFDFIETPLKLDDSCKEVSDWISNRLINNNCGNQLVLKCKPTVNPLLNFAFLRELRNSFTNVWIQEINGKFIAKQIDSKQRSTLFKDEEREREVVIEKMVGFSSIFKCLVESKRPIVGHNMIHDLLHIYHHFYKPLPKKLKDFKSTLNLLFPYIFDTKCILMNEKQNLEEIYHLIKNKGLGDIYSKLLDEEIVNNFVGSPKVEQIKDDHHLAHKEYSPHNAGFDAFITGFVFVKIGHILVIKKSTSDDLLTHNWFDLLKTLEMHCNKVNLIRANSHYLCISGTEPASPRPNWLYARQRDKKSHFSVSKVTSTLANKGTADIILIDSNSLLIAVSSHEMARSLISAFKNDTDIKVTEYSLCKHNKYMRCFLWSAFSLSTTLTGVLTHELIKTFKH